MKEAPLKNTIYAFLVLAIAACTPASTANSDTAMASASTTSASTTTAATTEASFPPAGITDYCRSRGKKAHERIPEQSRRTAHERGRNRHPFFPDVAPNHVKNFIDLAEKGFYN